MKRIYRDARQKHSIIAGHAEGDDSASYALFEEERMNALGIIFVRYSAQQNSKAGIIGL